MELRSLSPLFIALLLAGCPPTETEPSDDDDSYEPGDQEGPVITHTPPADTWEEGIDLELTATASDDTGVDRLGIAYRATGDTNFTTVPMAMIGENWVGNIPGDSLSPAGLEYYVTAADSLGNTGLLPADAPVAFFDLSIVPIPPSNPEGLVANWDRTEGGIALTWMFVDDPDFDRFEIYRGSDDTVSDADELVATLTEGELRSHLDTAEGRDSEYGFYRIYMHDIWGGEASSGAAPVRGLHLFTGTVLEGFSEPRWLHADGEDRLLVTETGAAQVVRLTASFETGSAWTEPSIVGPVSGQIGYNRELHVADPGSDQVVRFEEAGGGFTNPVRHSSFDVPDGTLELSEPRCLSGDTDSRYYICDSGNQQIVKLTSTFAWLDSWTEVEEGVPFGVTEALVQDPTTDRCGPDGCYLVADSGNDAVYAFNPIGGLVWTVGSAGSEEGQFTDPVQLHLALNSNEVYDLFVADSGNNRIQKFDSEGNVLMVIDAAEAGLTAPTGVTTSSDGHVYIADPATGRVAVFGP